MDGNESRVRSVARAMAILKCFLKASRLGITEISEMLGLSKGTVHLLVKALEDEGFLEQTGRSKKYRLGQVFYELGMGATGSNDLRSAARRHLQQLSGELSMPCYLAIEIGRKAVLIEKAEPVNPFMVVMQIGAILPYHTSSMGKILLAHMDAGERDQIIEAMEMPPLTPNTITNRDLLRKEIEVAAGQGFALDREETLPGVFCLAVPVKDGGGRVVAAMSLVAPSTALNESNHWQYLPAMQKYADLIARDMITLK